jgi:tetrapyrrole methylase family protein/MazG family protein
MKAADRNDIAAGTPSSSVTAEAAAAAYERLYRIVARLRAPGGCPWDREQTPKTLRGSIIEEAYELIEAIDEGDAPHVCEEAGDLSLNILMVLYMYEQEGAFQVADSLDAISDKLVRRHPHVFGDSKADTSEKVLKQWAQIKENVEGRRRKDSLLDEVSRAMPTLERAYKLQKKAAKVGFDWKDRADVWRKTREELDEAEEVVSALAEARDSDAGKGIVRQDDALQSRLEEELGDLLFSVVNLARSHGVDPGLALAGANEKFSRRFRHMERRMTETGRELSADNMEVMDGFWDEAKAKEKADS